MPRTRPASSNGRLPQEHRLLVDVDEVVAAGAAPVVVVGDRVDGSRCDWLNRNLSEHMMRTQHWQGGAVVGARRPNPA